MSRRGGAMVRAAAAALLLVPAAMCAEEAYPEAASLRRAVDDLARTFPADYAGAAAYRKRLDDLERRRAAGEDAARVAEDLGKLRAEALLANPLLRFGRLLLVKRVTKHGGLGLPQNWQGNCALPRDGYDDELLALSPIRPDGALSTVFKPETAGFIGDVDLHFDADRLLFSSMGAKGAWGVYEVRIDGAGLRRITPENEYDTDWYDGCYLPDGAILAAGTAVLAGVPCVGGGNSVANLFRFEPDGKTIRLLCFDQEHNWCPTVLNNGRVLYTRWEYTDTPHYFTRLLFQMNPDGTGQSAYYGSNSYWPNSIFFARPVPGHPTMVVGVISGHHGVPRMGELILFDPARGRGDADGVVQRVPGYGRPVPPVVADGLVQNSWPKFLHPWPLSEKYFLVSCQPRPDAAWGVYLADVFDNLQLVKELPGAALFEPVPLARREPPPALQNRVKPERRDATVYLTDVYGGPGLRGVPRGKVRSLRVFEYHYAYRRMGGHINVGVDGPWDVHRIVGTVPVEADGSAYFRVPANTPLAVQPLDEKGRALQVMRSWFTAMPGEAMSCSGCHESQNSTPPPRLTLASRKAPAEIAPWRGPTRGFSFAREVQPVLDRLCVGCHDGRDGEPGHAAPNLADTEHVMPAVDERQAAKMAKRGDGGFTQSYLALHPYVRRPGVESDYFLQKPLEFHARTSELVQLLEKGHHGVKLDDEAWDRLITWIDLNVPDHGTWHEHRAIPNGEDKIRREMLTKYGNRPEDPEEIVNPYAPGSVAYTPPPAAPAATTVDGPAAAGWPFDAAEARRRQEACGLPREIRVAVASNAVLDLVLVPPGEFMMGDAAGYPDEQPVARVRVEKPFYMSRAEIGNDLYRHFDPAHDSRYVHRYGKDMSTPGMEANRPEQPVIRVTWREAEDFCAWLSRTTGRAFSLPTESQWEYACRAGTATPLYYGGVGDDFGKFENLADVSFRLANGPAHCDWLLKVASVNDGAVVPAGAGRYEPNAWGLVNMHGNVAEWTRSAYRPYPYRTADDREAAGADGLRVARGGSYADRPVRARSGFRLAYEPWQAVFNVGLRVVCEPEPARVAAK